MTNVRKYLTPRLAIESSFQKLIEEQRHDNYYFRMGFGDKSIIQPEDLINYSFTFIVGEPGQGKTSLLHKLTSQAIEEGGNALCLNLRQRLAHESLEQAIRHQKTEYGEGVETGWVICLDGLDEVTTTQLPETIELIKRYATDHKDHKVYVASRLHFFSKYETQFAAINANYALLLPLEPKQSREFLSDLGLSEHELTTVIHHVRSSAYRSLIIETPRYLEYLYEWVQSHRSKLPDVNRASVFDHFVDQALLEEDRKNAKSLSELKRRTLEKLALVMETAQTNTITRQELITFIDVFKSDAKQILLNQLSIEELYDHSLIKDDGTSISFDNVELQEYLAACALSRMSNLSRCVFALTVDPDQRTIFPSWINSLSFLLEMHPELLDQILNLQTPDPTKPERPQDPDVHKLVTGVSSSLVAEETRTAIFHKVLSYYLTNNIYISNDVAAGLAFYATSDSKEYLKKTEEPSNTFELISVTLVVAMIQSAGLFDASDEQYWKTKFIEYANTSEQDLYTSVLQRQALYGLEFFHDTSVLEQTANTHTSKDELVRRAFENLCNALDPDSDLSIRVFVEGIKSENSLDARRGLKRISKPSGIKLLLGYLGTDTALLRQLLNHESIFEKEDKQLLESLDTNWDSGWLDLCKQIIQQAAGVDSGYYMDRSKFIAGFVRIVAGHDDNYFRETIDWADDDTQIHRLASIFSLLSRIMKPADLPYLVEKIKKATKLKWLYFRIIPTGNFEENPYTNEIEAEARKALPEEFAERDRAVAQARSSTKQDPILDEARECLEAARGAKNGDDIRLNSLAKLLTILTSQKNYVIENLDDAEVKEAWGLCCDLLLNRFDPKTFTLKIHEDDGNEGGGKSYTISSAVNVFYDLIEFAQKANRDISNYRAKLVDLIPFLYSDTLDACFTILGSLSNDEIHQLLEVYGDQKSDKARFMPDNIIEAAKRFSLIDAVPILDKFVEQTELSDYLRSEALETSERLKPNKARLEHIFATFGTNSPGLARRANALLITKHSDSEAIRWLIKDIERSAAAFVEITGEVHDVGPLEHELHGGEKAQPLKELSDPAYIKDYLDLLAFAFKLYAKGNGWHNYAFYLWQIVTDYFSQLKNGMRYAPLEELELWVANNSNLPGINFFKDNVVKLRKEYIQAITKPREFNDALKKANDLHENDSTRIISGEELASVLEKVIRENVVPWIEGEARKIIDETHAQKLIRVYLENYLMKEGFRPEDMKACNLIREPQTLADKRPDFLIYHGFIGPVVLELKLAKSGDLKGDMTRHESYSSLQTYMESYETNQAIFLVIDNGTMTPSEFGRKMKSVSKHYTKIRGVSVMGAQVPKGS